MKIVVHYEGREYETKETAEATVDEAMAAIYDNLDRLKKLKLELKGGGFLLLGGDAVKRCAIMVLDS